jgi:predicted DCC family thiol-disulfide oxidoreductase YuxK
MVSKKSIILFDGVCNLCNNSVQFVLKRDKSNQFLFASLQSDAAKKILLQLNQENLANNIDSILLVEENKLFTKSSAVLKISRKLTFPYSILYWFIYLPKFIRNPIYDLIAKNRYKWFGKKDQCMVPKKEYSKKFL